MQSLSPTWNTLNLDRLPASGTGDESTGWRALITMMIVIMVMIMMMMAICHVVTTLTVTRTDMTPTAHTLFSLPYRQHRGLALEFPPPPHPSMLANAHDSSIITTLGPRLHTCMNQSQKDRRQVRGTVAVQVQAHTTGALGEHESPS